MGPEYEYGVPSDASYGYEDGSYIDGDDSDYGSYDTDGDDTYDSGEYDSDYDDGYEDGYEDGESDTEEDYYNEYGDEPPYEGDSGTDYDYENEGYVPDDDCDCPPRCRRRPPIQPVPPIGSLPPFGRPPHRPPHTPGFRPPTWGPPFGRPPHHPPHRPPSLPLPRRRPRRVPVAFHTLHLFWARWWVEKASQRRFRLVNAFVGWDGNRWVAIAGVGNESGDRRLVLWSQFERRFEMEKV